MIDHILGRPSVKSRRLQVLAILGIWCVVLAKGHRHGFPGLQFLSRFFTTRLTAWQTFILTLLYYYTARNLSTLAGLAAPEPMASMYDAAYFRATWVMTALDAGFWTAMRIRSRWLRDFASLAFSAFYLFAAERADEKVRKIRGTLTVDHLRVSWNKPTTPYLTFAQKLVRPRFTKWPPRQIRIPRPTGSDYQEPVSAWLYYDGPVAELLRRNKIVLDIPGGGFVAMDPRCHDDRLLAWASKTGLPILSLDYRKAPEFPYPYALNECFDVYKSIVNTRGKCVGLSGIEAPRIVVSGDSAGGNLATAMTLMILEKNTDITRRHVSDADLPPPDGLILMYPSLDMNIGNWMTDEQMSLIRDRSMRTTNRPIVRRKSMQYTDLVGTPHHSDEEEEPTQKSLKDPLRKENNARAPHPEFSHGGPRSLSHPPVPGERAAESTESRDRSQSNSYRSQPLRTRLATSSMISYFNDRVLTPEMMRAMIILYIGPHTRPDFSTDYLLSPVLAPDYLLERFPKTYFLTGERDPLVDDTVIFAGRLKRVKEVLFRRMNPSRSEGDNDLAPDETELVFNEKDVAEVTLIPGISHGFLQFPTLYPPAWKLLDRCSLWIDDIFASARPARSRPVSLNAAFSPTKLQTSRDSTTDEEDRFLWIASTRNKANTKASRGFWTAGASGSGSGFSGRRQSEGSGVIKDQRRGSLTIRGADVDRGRRNGRRSGRGHSKDRSLVRLGSMEDLLGRRMEGLAGSLTGLGDEYGGT